MPFKWPQFDNFEKIAHKIAKSKYFVDIENKSNCLINSLSNDDVWSVRVSFVLQKLSMYTAMRDGDSGIY